MNILTLIALAVGVLLGGAIGVLDTIFCITGAASLKRLEDLE
jgi:hypothetical protein